MKLHGASTFLLPTTKCPAASLGSQDFAAKVATLDARPRKSTVSSLGNKPILLTPYGLELVTRIVWTQLILNHTF